jgi:hypothetical protein
MKGEVVYLYAFDVANEIVTKQVPEILGHKPILLDVRKDRPFPKDVPLYRPLTIESPPLPAKLNGQPARVLIRVYEIGVVSIIVRVGFEADGPRQLLPFHNGRLENGQTLDEVSRQLCEQVYHSLRKFMTRGSSPSEPEAYTVFCFTDLGGATDVNRWLTDERRNVAGLLTETDPARLSEAQIAEVLRLNRSFENTDLVVIDWDAALVIDLAGYVDDVLYTLELANLQLEEFRTMDNRLDRYLNRAYDDLERRRFSLLGADTKVLRVLRRFRVDFTKLADEVTHITKFTGDWHLARVFLAARERFYLEQWRASVDQRLVQLDRLYSVVHAEINERRMLWLEIIVVIFFAIELFGTFWFRK